MKATIQLVILFFLMSCGSQTDKISNASDLKNLAGVLNIELQMAKIEPVCSEAGLQEVEKFLEGKTEAEQQQYVVKVGAYLGECIIQSYGGEWVEYKPGTWAVKLAEDNLVFPIGKVQKYVEDSTFDSFSHMYGAIPSIFQLNKKAP